MRGPQCSFWHALLQYSTLLHALHVLRPPLGQPGHAQRRRSLAPDAPALETEEAALFVAPLFVAPLFVAPLFVAPLSAEQSESVTGCGEIDKAEVGEELSRVALGLVALGALGDQRRDGGGERSSRAL